MSKGVNSINVHGSKLYRSCSSSFPSVLQTRLRFFTFLFVISHQTFYLSDRLLCSSNFLRGSELLAIYSTNQFRQLGHPIVIPCKCNTPFWLYITSHPLAPRRLHDVDGTYIQYIRHDICHLGCIPFTFHLAIRYCWIYGQNQPPGGRKKKNASERLVLYILFIVIKFLVNKWTRIINHEKCNPICGKRNNKQETRKTAVSLKRHKARRHWKCNLSFSRNLAFLQSEQANGSLEPCSMNLVITSFNVITSCYNHDRRTAFHQCELLITFRTGERVFTSVNFKYIMLLQMTTFNCLNVW